MQNEKLTFLKSDAIDIVTKNYEYFSSMIMCSVMGKINLDEAGIKMSELKEYVNLLREQLILIHKIDNPIMEIPKHLFDRVKELKL
tara:strand:- start:34 stop:291 length:258 start_codon:yes stop_codon:yes gene_type:complete